MILKILQGEMNGVTGEVLIHDDIHIGYVQQNIENYTDLHGGQRFNQYLTEALTKDPTCCFWTSQQITWIYKIAKV